MRSAPDIPLGSAFLFLQDSLLMTLVLRKGGSSGRKKVLITRPDGIGDLILFTDALSGIRRLFPETTHEITMIASHQIGDLVQGIKGPDRTLIVDRSMFLKKPSYRWRFMSRIRKERFDVALNPVYSRVPMLEDAIIRASGAPVRTAWEGNLDNTTAFGRRIADRWYTDLFAGEENSPMELQRNARFVRNLGLKDFKPALPRIEVQNSWLESSSELLASSGISGSYGIVVPGTGLPPERAWPPQRYGELVLRLLNFGMDHVIVAGGEGDKPLAQQVVLCAERDEVHDFAGKTSLGTLAGCMSGATIVVGSDTGAVHLGSALDIPTLCILGGAFPGRFFPYRMGDDIEDGFQEDPQADKAGPVVVASPEDCHCPRWNCTNEKWRGGTFPCILAIEVEDVMEGISRLLG